MEQEKKRMMEQYAETVCAKEVKGFAVILHALVR